MKNRQRHPIHRLSIKYCLVQATLYILGGLAKLPYSVLGRLGLSLGHVAYHLNSSHRRIALVNLKLCFPELSAQQRHLLAKKHFELMGLGCAESLMLWLGPKDRWQHKIEISGQHHLENAISLGNGVLLLGMHLTTLEIGGLLLATKIPMSAFYRPNQNSIIEDIMVAGRRRYLSSTIPRQDTRRLVRCLKNNGAVWYAPDQDLGLKGSVFSSFFGIPAATVTATSRFVRLSAAQVIPLTQERVGDEGKIKITLHPPLLVSGEDVQNDTDEINTFIEQYVRAHPEQYFWTHKRFKTRPSTDAKSYYPQKKGWSKVTPSVFEYLLKHAEWREEKDGKTHKIKNYQGIIYFIYREDGLLGSLSPSYKKFIKTLEPEWDDNKRYSFQGLVRRCKFKNCDLVYLQED